jgi:hypothetical protein
MARTTRPHSTDYDYNVATKTLKHDLSPDEIAAAWEQYDLGSITRDELSDLLSGNHSGWYGNVRTDTNQVLGICTEQYGKVQNSDLIGAIEEAFDNVNMTDYEKAIYSVRDGARVYARYDFPNKTKATQVGDEVGLRLTANNSFDRSCRISFSLGLVRLVCTNGMVTMEDEYSMTKKHTQQVSVDFIEDAIRNAVDAFDNGKPLAVYDRLAAREITQAEGVRVLGGLEKKNLLSTRLREGIESVWIAPTHEEDKERNLYNLMNAVTQHLTREVEGERFEYSDGINRKVLRTLDKAARQSTQFDLLVA